MAMPQFGLKLKIALAEFILNQSAVPKGNLNEQISALPLTMLRKSKGESWPNLLGARKFIDVLKTKC